MTPKTCRSLPAMLTVAAALGCADGPTGATETSADRNGAHFERSFGARVSSYDAQIPLAYYELSLAFSKRTGGFTPPVQSRAYAYMGLALYEALVGGMPNHKSIAPQLNGIGESKLTAALIEKKIGVSGTARNWNTAQKIAAALQPA